MQVLPPSALSSLQKLTKCAGQSSRNKLIVFADGTYLELFCWIDTPREFYAWANKSPGLIDFALSSLPPLTALSLHHHVLSQLGGNESSKELDISYTLPEAGSRLRWDDVQVKWESSRPVSAKSVNRTDFPFFCHDVTPRNIRVPFEDKRKTTHQCGAVGISGVEVLVPRSASDTFAELYGLILGVPPRDSDEHGNHKRSDFEVGLPNQGFSPSTVTLRLQSDERDLNWLRDHGTGICGLVISIAGREGHGEEVLGVEGNASTVSLKW